MNTLQNPLAKITLLGQPLTNDNGVGLGALQWYMPCLVVHTINVAVSEYRMVSAGVSLPRRVVHHSDPAPHRMVDAKLR